MRYPALSVSSISRWEHFCYELWGLEMLLPDRLCEDLILLSLAHQCLTIKTYIWNFSVFRTWARTGPLVTSVSSEALWASLALHLNALWCHREESDMQSCHDFLTMFPLRPKLHLLLLDATLAVCQHLTKQQVLLLGTGQHLEICLNQGGGPPFKQEKIYGSPAVLQRFLSGSAQEDSWR